MLEKIAYILLIVGGLNWLLVGLLGQDLGVMLFGGMDAAVSKVIYVLVGLSAVWALFTLKKKSSV